LVAIWLDHVLNQAHFTTEGLYGAIKETDSGGTMARVNEADWCVMPFTGFKRDAVTYEAEFLSFEAETALFPSIRYDYPELHMTLDDVYNTYYTFAKRVPRKGLIIGNSDYARMKRLRVHLADRHIETYGIDRDAAWHIRNVTQADGKTVFYLANGNKLYGPFEIPFIGEVFFYAAAAVCVATLALELNPEAIGRGLSTLPKVRRYFTCRHDREDRLVIDDCADHPETIKAVLETIKDLYPDKKIWCLYQPGSYLRAKSLFSELKDALMLSDFLYIADIKGYPKEKSEGLHTRHIVSDMKQTHPSVYYLDPTMDMTTLLRDRVKRSDCIVTLGADGFLQQITAPLFAQPSERPVV
jgi:UDP-N-acetylmuramate--alanine ligase